MLKYVQWFVFAVLGMPMASPRPSLLYCRGAKNDTDAKYLTTQVPTANDASNFEEIVLPLYVLIEREVNGTQHIKVSCSTRGE